MSSASFSPLVIDLILIGLILLTAFIRGRVGLYHIVASAAIVFIALAAAFICADSFTEPVHGFVWEKASPKIDEYIEKSVEKAIGNEGLAAPLSGDIPSDGAAVSDDSLSAAVKDAASGVYSKLKAVTMLKAELTVKKFVKFGIFLISFIVVLLILKLIVKLTDKAIKISPIGKFNHFGGFLFGLLEACVVLLVVIRGAGFFNISFFRNISQDTVVLKWFIGGDIQGAINAIKDLSLSDVQNMSADDLKKLIPPSVKDLVDNLDSFNVTDVIDKIDPSALTEKLPDIDIPGAVDKLKDTVSGAGGN